MWKIVGASKTSVLYLYIYRERERERLSECNPKTQIYSHVPNSGTLETLKVDFDLVTNLH